MHYIQSYILDKLIYSAKLRNRDMRPPAVESNLYQYHLLQLQKEGFVVKADKLYSLSSRGLAYADRHSTTLKKTRSQPKLITVLFLADHQGKLLFAPRPRQPFAGMLNLPSGKIHLDETIAQAAAREFSEKVSRGVSLSSLEHAGVAHLTIKQGDFVISDYIALLMKGSITVTGPLPSGALMCDIATAKKMQLMPSVANLLDAYQSGDAFSEHSISID